MNSSIPRVKKDKHGFYEMEKYVMTSLYNRTPIRADEFVSEILGG